MLKIIRSRINTIILASTAWIVVSASYMPVFAEGDDGGIKLQTAGKVSTEVVTVVNDVLMPIGGMVIFITIIICAFKIITTANKPNERAEAMTSLPYIALGGVLLGGALLFSGLIFGLMDTLHKVK